MRSKGKKRGKEIFILIVIDRETLFSEGLGPQTLLPRRRIGAVSYAASPASQLAQLRSVKTSN